MSVKAVRVKDIMGVMEEIAPKKLAENWDKPGLAIGDPEREVKKILVALDVIDPVVEEAKRIGADMIVTHHPMLLFRKIRCFAVYDIQHDDFVAVPIGANRFIK